MRNALTFTTSIKFAYMLTVFACLPVIAHASSVCPFTWERNLTIGMHGDDVRALQRFLNADNHTRIAAHGAGSPGAESSYFGLATKRALSIFQEKYASDILIPSGITKGSGIFGIATRQKLHAICSTVSNTDMSTNTQTAAVAAVETVMLRIGTTTQPAASIAPHDALYVPFTTFTMTAQHGDITVRSVTVERVGPSHIGAFSYLSLLDEAGNELSYTYLHTDQKAVFSKPFIVHAGETKTLTIAGAMAADLSEYDDETATFALDAIDASAPVVGPLPVRGTFQKINASLQIGTASVTLSSYGPSVATTHTINDTSVRFSGIRITAGSQEDQILYAITWRQIGTINPSDIQNVRVIAGDTSAATDVDGRDYTANFPDGIRIKKGNTLDVYIQGDIGTTGSNRTVQFTIDDGASIYLLGDTYGYGIYPIPAGNTGIVGDTSAFLTEDGTTDTDSIKPFFVGSPVTISGAIVNAINKI